MIVARCNGTVLVEESDRLGIAEQGGSWIPAAIFVFGLLASILLVNGIVMLFTMSAAVGAGFTAGAVVFGVAAYLLLGLRRRKRDAPLPAPWLVFDRGGRTVVNGNGSQITTFDRVKLERAFQAGSSSKMLVMQHPGGRIVLARGNPFGDSVDAVEAALRRAIA
ncbi:MAG TPA: hypothetical protein VM261_18680 [Kofleriaceae bacterium]|nr:hypothetical protein [Kofleriaceae bacterium]